MLNAFSGCCTGLHFQACQLGFGLTKHGEQDKRRDERTKTKCRGVGGGGGEGRAGQGRAGQGRAKQGKKFMPPPQTSSTPVASPADLGARLPTVAHDRQHKEDCKATAGRSRCLQSYIDLEGVIDGPLSSSQSANHGYTKGQPPGGQLPPPHLTDHTPNCCLLQRTTSRVKIIFIINIMI